MYDIGDRESRRVRVVGIGALARALAAGLEARALLPELASRLAPEASRAALMIAAPEGVRYAEVMALEEAARRGGVAFLPVLAGAGCVEIGPTVLPGAETCFACSRLHLLFGLEELAGAAGELRTLEQMRTAELAPGSALALGMAAAAAARAAAAMLGRPPEPRLLSRVLRFHAGGRRQVGEVEVASPCPRCASRERGRGEPLSALEAAAELALLPRHFAPTPPRRAKGRPGSRVAVVGGGTAGYLSALALRRKLPGVEVTLIESSEIPPIGVGESTTPLLPAFLHGTLGLDMGELHREVEPTWKLGIHFDWGRPEGPGFAYPFQRGHLLESLAYEGGLGAYSPASLLMAAGRGPLLDLGEGRLDFLPMPFAYHVDNHRLATYLRRRAEAAGVRILDRRIAEVELAEAGGERRVSALLAAEGERMVHDVYLDCTGFRSLLLGEALGVGWESFSGSLFTDTAVVGALPHGVAPYPSHTVAATMDHGWCWAIPMREELHVGYVFSSAHASAERVEAELRQRFPGLGATRLVPFVCGRRQRVWEGNVVAVGNAAGFVEPLESTALHMVIVTVLLLLRHWPGPGPEPAGRAGVNRYLADFWDQLRWFLALHFRFNRRRETSFWRDCREGVDIRGGEELLALYRERAPLSCRPHLLEFDGLWGDFGRDVLLLGQGVETRLLEPRMDRRSWQRLLARGRALADRALGMDRAARAVAADPEILLRLQRRAPWLQDAAVGGRQGW